MQRLKTAAAVAGERMAVLFVDDRSTDDSWTVAVSLARHWPDVGAVGLPRNLGQQRAVQEGLHFARGTCAVFMDADLQDRPEDVPRMVSRIREGFDVVFARRTGNYQGRSRMITSRLFRRILGLTTKVPVGCGMFMAIGRTLVETILATPGKGLYIPALVGIEARRVGWIPVARDFRLVGRSSYSAFRRGLFGFVALRFLLRHRLFRSHSGGDERLAGVVFVAPAAWAREGTA